MCRVLRYRHCYGAPNVTVIFDASEVSDQDTTPFSRDEKTVQLTNTKVDQNSSGDILLFPGSFDLRKGMFILPPKTKLHIDVGYDVADAAAIVGLEQPIETILLSTSSQLFVFHQRPRHRSFA